MHPKIKKLNPVNLSVGIKSVKNDTGDNKIMVPIAYYKYIVIFTIKIYPIILKIQKSIAFSLTIFEKHSSGVYKP